MIERVLYNTFILLVIILTIDTHGYYAIGKRVVGPKHFNTRAASSGETEAITVIKIRSSLCSPGQECT